MKIEYIFAVFALIGMVDKICGNRLKLGQEFEKAIMTMGPLAIAMSGMLILAPVIATGLSVVITPIANALGMDPSVVGTFLPNDSGGAAIAYQLSDDFTARGYNGMIVASMFGATTTLIPMSLKMVDSKHHEDVLSGLLCGLVTIPIGCLVSSFMIGLPFIKGVLNILPSVILSVLICIGLVKAPNTIKKVLAVVGEIIFAGMVFGLGVGIFYKLTGVAIIPGMETVDYAFSIIGYIAVVLAGVLPLLSIISRVFGKLFVKFGKLVKINDTAVLGLITHLANSIPVFSMMNDMDKRGRIFNMAFAVSAGYVFGDQLAFALSYDGAFALPMVVGKLVSAVTAVVLAAIVYRKTLEQ